MKLVKKIILCVLLMLSPCQNLPAFAQEAPTIRVTIQNMFPAIWTAEQETVKTAIGETIENFMDLTDSTLPDMKLRVVLMIRPLYYTMFPIGSAGVYFNGQIFIPLDLESNDLNKLADVVDHEFTHAIFQAITHSKGMPKIPRWLNEGFAQVMEVRQLSKEKLIAIMHDYLTANPIIKLSKLRNTVFIKHDQGTMLAVYGESFIAAKLLVRKHGFKAIRTYLDLIGNDEPPEQAFQKAFGESIGKFEKSAERFIKFNYVDRMSDITPLRAS